MFEVSSFIKKIQLFFGFGSEDETGPENNKMIRAKEAVSNATRRRETAGREHYRRILPSAFREKETAGDAEVVQESKSRKKLSLIGSPGDKSISSVFIAAPEEFEEIQVIADRFKANVPVIINLQNTNQDLSKRVIDFCSGLTYALEGNIKKVADKVFLITPYNVEVSSKENQLLKENGLFDPYNSFHD
ncbi:MAG: cell division protein SepF [Actinobacteria bacterium]|nr:cell division protein SepF [Actinomycetota bacterium]